MSLDIVIGHPGEGKTYFATMQGLRSMKEGKICLSNYPIVSPDGKYRSCIWKKEYATLPSPPTNCTIIIDEAYRDYNSRRWAEFKNEEHIYFSTNRHNKLEIYIIVQNPARIDITLQEIANFILASKISFFGLFTFGFKYQYFAFLEDLSAKKVGINKSYKSQLVRFKKYIAKSYDTHYYRIQNIEEFKPEPWIRPIDEEISKIFKNLEFFYSMHGIVIEDAPQRGGPVGRRVAGTLGACRASLSQLVSQFLLRFHEITHR